MISELIRRIRETRDLSYDKLGAIIGVTGRTVYNWQRGRSQPNRYYTAILDEIARDADIEPVNQPVIVEPAILETTVYIVNPDRVP